ncbi:MAG: histidine kinase [Mucilaginibacter sp.]
MKRKYVALLHILIWSSLIVTASLNDYNFNNFSGSSHALTLFKSFIITCAYYSVSVVCFYSSYLLVAPRLFLKRQYIVAIFYAVIILAVIIGWRYIIEFNFLKPVLNFDNYKGHIPKWEYYIQNIFYYYFPSYFAYGLMCFFVEAWYKNNRRQQELQKEKLITELAFLRSQINPHFLFNTINDIYTLTYQQSEQAPEALLKLSVILRYMLRDGNEDFMPLSREYEYLENVIALQRIGAKGLACINFVKEGYIGDQLVASLLFISFVENAFKHGVLDDDKSPIEIYLNADNTTVTFKVANKKNNAFKDKMGGIGLCNVLRRLELIYPEKHSLTIDENEEFYKVNLVLKLS